MSPLRLLRRQFPPLRAPMVTAIVLGTLGAALVASACGGGSGGSTATPTTTPAAPVLTATSEPIPTATPEPNTVYTVQAGDTAWAIAIEFGITLAQLAAANGVTEAELENLQIGQQLQIPRAAADP